MGALVVWRAFTRSIDWHRYLFPDLPGILQKPLQFASKAITKTPIQGAQTSIYLATSPEVVSVSGKYYADCKPKTTSEESYDVKVSRVCGGGAAAMLSDTCSMTH